jgi:hypothetical protein
VVRRRFEQEHGTWPHDPAATTARRAVAPSMYLARASRSIGEECNCGLVRGHTVGFSHTARALSVASSATIAGAVPARVMASAEKTRWLATSMAGSPGSTIVTAPASAIARSQHATDDASPAATANSVAFAHSSASSRDMGVRASAIGRGGLAVLTAASGAGAGTGAGVGVGGCTAGAF